MCSLKELSRFEERWRYNWVMDPRESLIRKALMNGMSLTQVSLETGIPKGSLPYLMRRFGLKPAQKKFRMDPEELRRMYVDQGLSILRIASITGRSDRSILDWLRTDGVQTRPTGTNQHAGHTIETAAEIFSRHGHRLLARRYVNVEKPMPYICRCGRKAKMQLAVARRGASCKPCSALAAGMKSRKSDAELSKLCEVRGVEYLGTSRSPNGVYIDFRCSCGSFSSQLVGNFRKAKGCGACKPAMFRGEKNWNWNPNLSEYDRQEIGRYEEGYKSWSRAVKARDQFKCTICEAKRGLVSHHLDGYDVAPEKRTDLGNGVTLCLPCHKAFHGKHGYGNNTREQFEAFRRTRRS